MNLINQQIAANADESAGGAEELSGRADELKSKLSSFRFSDNSKSTIRLETPVTSMQAPERAGLKGSENDIGDHVSTRSAPSRSLAANAAEMIPFGDTDSRDGDRF
jgi:hypothetical protein